jgi:hypothetical protein
VSIENWEGRLRGLSQNDSASEMEVGKEYGKIGFGNKWKKGNMGLRNW